MPRPPRIQHVVTTVRRATTAQHRPPPVTGRLPPRPPPRTGIAADEQPHLPSPKSGRVGRILTGCIGGGLAFYITVLIYQAAKPTPNRNPLIADLSQQKDVSAVYDSTANSFDSEVNLSEWLMGINNRRDRLAKMCNGHVLEVSCGTGRNLGYFDIGLGSKVESLTFVDLSPKMVEVCRRKWDVLHATGQTPLKKGLIVRFMTGSAVKEMPPPPDTKKRKYDTILQTMGICSTPSPVALLTNLAKHLDTSNPDARILLLEHGRSYRDWLNKVLDDSAEKHAEIHGCWFNRDIGAIVEEAAEKAGLEVVREKRWHLGTTWVFELKAKDKVASIEEEEAVVAVPEKKSGWFGWS